MLYFENDYCEGAHEAILKRLMETNMEKVPGYGQDPFCDKAKEKIKEACGCPDGEVYFLVGGTQTNAVVIASVLNRYEGVLSAVTGHVNAHEAGAIEFTGHKVLPLPQDNGKISAADLKDYLQTYYADGSYDHMVFPGMVYISHPTEYGDDTWQEDWQGKTVDFSVEVTDVTASNTPEYDEDYVKNYTGYDTKEEYEASVKEYLEQSYEEQSTYDETEDLISACLARTEFTGEYPDDLFEACREEALSGYSMFVGEDGDVSDVLDMFGVTEDDIAEEAKNLVNRRLFISAYAEANNIEVTEDEYVDYVNEYADYYGESPADFETLYTRETLVNALYESKVTELLLEKANVTETPYTPEDYDEEESEEDDTLDDLEIVEEGEEGVAE